MSRVKVTREQFREAFLAAWKNAYYAESDRRSALEVIYRDSWSGWTEVMLGKRPQVLKGRRCLIWRAFEELSKIVGASIQTDLERQDVDAFGRVVREPHNCHTDGANLVMVEVENDTKKSYEEFWKLVHSRCPLKVLVTYRAPTRPDELKVALDRMQAIYKHAKDVLGDDLREAYLLVVGTRAKEKSPEILWEFYGLNSDGYFAEVVE
jgi:hypothetical protein